MKKALALFLVLLVILIGCNTNKAKIKNIDIVDTEYNKETDFLSFNVSINPNKFDELKVYFISEEKFNENNYGDYWKMYEDKLPGGKFTLSLEGKEKTKYVLFAWAKGFDQKEYQSKNIIVDLSGTEVTITTDTSN